MKNMKVKKALMAIGAVMALGMAIQGHAQPAPAPTPTPTTSAEIDAADLNALKASDYSKADADLKSICAQPADAGIVGDNAPAGYCTEEGRTYNANANDTPT